MTNPEITNNDPSSIFINGNRFQDITLTAAGAATYLPGRVLAFNASTGKYEITISGTAAVANAKAVLAQEITFTGAGDKFARVCLIGSVDENLLIFDGSDTVDTIPASAADSFRTQLRSYGILAENPVEQRIQDNQ